MKSTLQKICCLFVTTIIILISINRADAQSTGSISGTVTTTNGEPGNGITVKIKGQSKNAITNADGNFKITGLAAANYELTISHVGFESQRQAVTIVAGQNIIVSIQLKASDTQLQEVVVRSANSKFGNKESESVARMPLANLENPQVYQVITNQLMKEQVITDYKSALKNATGASTLLQANNGRSYTFMRGFITSNFVRNGLGASQYSAIDPANIDRIEVIKGPSGTLFGTGLISYGGLVNRITKKPFDTPLTELTYSGGSFGLNRFTADINTPLNADKTVLFRLNAAYHRQGSFMDSGFERNFLIAPSLTYKVNDRLTINVDAELYKRHTSGLATYSIDDLSFFKGKSFNDIPLGYNRSYSGNDIDTRLTNYNVYLQAGYKISEHWKSQTLFTFNGVYAPDQRFMDATILDNSTMQRSVSKLSDKYHTTEIQQNFNGDFNIGTIRNRVLIGLDLTAFKQDPNYYISAAYDKINYTQPGSFFISRAQYDNALSGQTKAPSDQKTYNYAAYVADVINITDRLLAMLSLRIDRYDDKGYRDLTTGETAPGFAQTKASPKLGLVYQLIKNQLSLFGNYQNGFNYSNQKAEDGHLFKPEQAYQYEGGLKWEAFNNKLSATLSYYDILVKDKLRADPNNPNFSLQDATQKSNGVEAEIIANPVRGLNILLGYGYNKSVYTKADPDIEGKRPYSTPANIFNTWISYTIPEGTLKGAGIGAGGNYASKSFFDDGNQLILPSYVTISSTLFYDRPKYRIGVKADNINNKHYWAPFGQPQATRSFTANVSYKF